MQSSVGSESWELFHFFSFVQFISPPDYNVFPYTCMYTATKQHTRKRRVKIINIFHNPVSTTKFEKLQFIGCCSNVLCIYTSILFSLITCKNLMQFYVFRWLHWLQSQSTSLNYIIKSRVCMWFFDKRFILST